MSGDKRDDAREQISLECLPRRYSVSVECDHVRKQNIASDCLVERSGARVSSERHTQSSLVKETNIANISNDNAIKHSVSDAVNKSCNKREGSLTLNMDNITVARRDDSSVGEQRAAFIGLSQAKYLPPASGDRRGSIRVARCQPLSGTAQSGSRWPHPQVIAANQFTTSVDTLDNSLKTNGNFGIATRPVTRLSNRSRTRQRDVNTSWEWSTRAAAGGMLMRQWSVPRNSCNRVAPSQGMHLQQLSTFPSASGPTLRSRAASAPCRPAWTRR